MLRKKSKHKTMKHFLIILFAVISFSVTAQNKRIRDLSTESNPVGTMYVPVDQSGYSEAKKMTITKLNSLEKAERVAADTSIWHYAGLKSSTGIYNFLTTSNFLTVAEFAGAGLAGSLNNADFILDSICQDLYDSVTAITVNLDGVAFLNSNVYFGSVNCTTHYEINADTIIDDKGVSSIQFGKHTGSKLSTGSYNVFAGNNAGYKQKTSDGSVFIGYGTAKNGADVDASTIVGYRCFPDETADFNSVYGYNSGTTITTGEYNSLFGGENMNGLLTTGSYNTIMGWYAGNANYANENIFLGYTAGALNLSGTRLTLIGVGAGYNNLTVNDVTAVGYQAGYNNTATQNTYLGGKAGYSHSTGTSNLFVGYKSGYDNTTGFINTYVGQECGMTSTASYMTALGYKAGYSTSGNYNTFIGHVSGFSNTSGIKNTFLGNKAGYDNTTGKSSILIGSRTGYTGVDSACVYIGNRTGIGNTSGASLNTFVGNYISGAGTLTTGSKNTSLGNGNFSALTTGVNNITIGTDVATRLTTGSGNIIIGDYAGYSITAQDNYNIMIGYLAGYSETGSYKLYIENTNSATPLIYGDFANDSIRINGKLSATNYLNVYNGMQFMSEKTMVKDTIIMVSADSVNACDARPYRLLLAPGAGKVIEVISASIFLDYNSAAYENQQLTLLNGSTVFLTSSGILNNTADSFSNFVDSYGDSVLNKQIRLSTTGAVSTGNSPIYIHLTYSIVKYQ